MQTIRPGTAVGLMLVGWTLACSSGSNESAPADTDNFAPDPVAPGEVVTNQGHLVQDLVGMWSAQVPKAQQRKMEILSAGREGRAPDLDPPLTDEEQGWLTEVRDPTSVAYHWWYCATRCQFEIRDSALWSHGYLVYDATGSGLVDTEIAGRDVTFHLQQHDPNGHRGTVMVRMNKDWTAFKVIQFDTVGYLAPHTEELFVFTYARTGGLR